MAARNQAKAAGAHAEILAAHPDASLEIVELDLGSLASVGTAANLSISAWASMMSSGPPRRNKASTSVLIAN